MRRNPICQILFTQAGIPGTDAQKSARDANIAMFIGRTRNLATGMPADNAEKMRRSVCPYRENGTAAIKSPRGKLFLPALLQIFFWRMPIHGVRSAGK